MKHKKEKTLWDRFSSKLRKMDGYNSLTCFWNQTIIIQHINTNNYKAVKYKVFIGCNLPQKKFKSLSACREYLFNDYKNVLENFRKTLEPPYSYHHQIPWRSRKTHNFFTTPNQYNDDVNVQLIIYNHDPTIRPENLFFTSLDDFIMYLRIDFKAFKIELEKAWKEDETRENERRKHRFLCNVGHNS